MNKLETWNGLREFPVPGTYFELLSTVNPVDVVAYDSNGQVLSVEKQVESGYFIDRRDGVAFARIEITTGGNEAVKFIITDGLSGSHSLPANISDRASRLLGIVYGSLGQLAQRLMGGVNALEVSERGIVYGAAFKSTTVLAANVSEAVFTPAANVNGAILHRASGIGGQVTGVPQYGLIAHTAAPNGFAAGDVLATGKVVYANTTYVATLLLERPVLIAAGKGLYWNSSILEAVGLRNCLYTLL